MKYKLRLDLFEGPLDLLLYLIKKNDIDIKDIPIALVTEQYMEYIELMKILDLDIVGDFLVMAATLMHIKSKMLLPPDPTLQEEEEEDPRDELARRLLEYKKFKEIADTLQDKEKLRRDFFSRFVDEVAREQLKEDAKEVLLEVNLFDLINAFSEALKKLPEEIIHEIIDDKYTVDDKVHDLLHALLEASSLALNDLFKKCRSRTEVVVTFLAILELIRLQEIKVIQQEVFGPIEILRNRENILPKDSSDPEDQPPEAS
ncbi:MAG TPA: segregation/condensation protein A [Candidatus Omnitrophota bacterium]|nr:segregation/condensation protein A [Candidatus Omnitrophota bacterium]